MQNLPKEIQDRFNELPKVVQDIILNSGWEKTTRHIVEKYNLRIDQGAVIEEETMFVMFGFDEADKFTENIMREAKIDRELAEKITEEINNDVFKLITEKLVETTTENEDSSSFSPKKNEEVVVNTPHTPVISKEQESEEVVKEQSSQEISFDNNTEENPSVERPSTEDTPKNDSSNTNSLVEENLSKPEVQKPTSIDPYLEPIE
jgi:hypothetical protein